MGCSRGPVLFSSNRLESKLPDHGVSKALMAFLHFSSDRCESMQSDRADRSIEYRNGVFHVYHQTGLCPSCLAMEFESPDVFLYFFLALTLFFGKAQHGWRTMVIVKWYAHVESAAK